MPGPRLLAVLPFAALLALAAGCDSLPGPQPVDPDVPSATARVCFAPALPDACQTTVVWEALPEALREGDSVAVVPVQIEAGFSEGTLSSTYSVAWQFGREPLVVGSVPREEGGFIARDTLRLARGARGAYSVLVTPEGAGGVVGAAARAQLTFAGDSQGPPLLADPAFPETFRPPGALEIAVSVSDPDGAVNVSDVEARSDVLGLRLPLRDDGQGGDRAAGDGRYTVRVQVPRGFPAGAFPFRLTATDRDGRAAAPLSFTVTFTE